MNDEIHLISDGDGLAVIGEQSVVDRFLASEGLRGKNLGLEQLGPVLGAGAAAAQAGSALAAGSGRWVKLTRESAEALKKYPLMQGSTEHVSRAVLTDNGKVKGLLELASTHGSLLSNPAVLAGAAGIMAQLAMQQTMDEITDYLATIDEKVDDVLRAQKDAVLADMIGLDAVIEEAMMIREQVGRVSEVTWSKVQATSVTIARTQAYALRQLDALAEKMERKNKLGDLAKASEDADVRTREWLAVLARCFQLQDALAVLELDRVLDASPEELEQHRLALRAARQNRRDFISQSTERLMARMDEAAGTANAKVLLHPRDSRTVVQASNDVAVAVVDFHARLGIERDRETLEARRWVDAAADVRDKVLETGTEGVGAARDFSADTFGRARAATGKFSSRIAERAGRRRKDDEDDADQN